ncbi:MAG: DUF362 domain-containing protein [Candidatus Freyarchaeota archaeon]
MKVDPEKCTGCWRCIPYCPVGAIKEGDDVAFIDQDECVECGVCLRSGACKAGALYQPELTWPRILRSQFSDPLAVHPKTKIAGRGTEEMKTNDVTGRFKEGEVGIAVEMGRPGIGSSFRDLEKVAMAIAKVGVEFEPSNPVTFLLDTKTGKLKYPEVADERVLSAIIECKTTEDKAVDVLKALKEAAGEIDSVFSVCVISKCKDGKIPIKPIIEKEGFIPRINGKTCIGLGRPLIP